MSDVRANNGVPVAAQFFGLTTPSACAPLVVNTATGYIYALATGDTVVGAAVGGTVTSVAQTFTGGLISVAGSPITTAGTLALTVAGTSGGIPYFSGATTWASSAALAANAIVLGGGAGAAPATTTTGTGVVTALGVNVGTAGAFVTFNGVLGTPSSGVGTNITGLDSANFVGTNWTDLTDAGDSTLHFHSSDRDSANFTGTNWTDLTDGGTTTLHTHLSGIASSITVANEATDTTCFPVFVTAATGDLGPKSNTGLTFDSSTATLAATAFSGPLTGNASTATALQTARTIGGTSFDGTANIVPSLITAANEATDTTCFLAFVTAATGDLQPKTNANLTLNSATGIVTFASAVLTTADINGGTIDGVTIGGAAAGAGTFTTLTVSGGTILGIATQNVFNTVSTTVNAFGAATTLNLGAATGTLTVNNATFVANAGTFTSGAFGTTPATAGAVRIPNNTAIASRNAANNANITVIFVDSSNQVSIPNNVVLTGSNLLTNQTTYNLLPNTATTVNAFGATSTALNLGNTSGVTTINGSSVSRIPNGIRIGADSTNNLLDDATNGAGTATLFIGNASINVTSDRRMKPFVRPTERDVVKLIDAFEVVDHDWKKDSVYEYMNERGLFMGVIAQQVYEAGATWAVNKPGNPDDLWFVEHVHLVAPLIRDAQITHQRLAALEARLQ